MAGAQVRSNRMACCADCATSPLFITEAGRSPAGLHARPAVANVDDSSSATMHELRSMRTICGQPRRLN